MHHGTVPGIYRLFNNSKHCVPGSPTRRLRALHLPPPTPPRPRHHAPRMPLVELPSSHPGRPTLVSPVSPVPPRSLFWSDAPETQTTGRQSLLDASCNAPNTRHTPAASDVCGQGGSTSCSMSCRGGPDWSLCPSLAASSTNSTDNRNSCLDDGFSTSHRFNCDRACVFTTDPCADSNASRPASSSPS